jgi:hypothetical protein
VGHIVFATPSQPGTNGLRTSRGIAALCVLLAYLLAGAFHGFCHLDVTAPASGVTAISMPVTPDSHHSGKMLAADEHCHGCFSITIPAPAMLATRAQSIVSRPSPLRTPVAILAPSIDTPPPKHLT